MPPHLTKTSLRSLSLGALLLAGLLARLVWMAHAPFPNRYWMDERYSAAVITQPAGTLIDLCRKDVHPPLYYLALKAWNSLDGTHRRDSRHQIIDYHLPGIGREGIFTIHDAQGTQREITGLFPGDWRDWPLAPLSYLRLLSIIFAIAMAGFIYALACKLWPDRPSVAWIGTVAVLFSPYMLTWDTVIRSYSMQGVLVAALALTMIRASALSVPVFLSIAVLITATVLTGYLPLLFFPPLVIAHSVLYRKWKASAQLCAVMGVGLIIAAAFWGRAFLEQGALRQVPEGYGTFFSRFASSLGEVVGIHWQMLFSYGVLANLNPFESPIGYLVTFIVYAACLGAMLFKLIKQPSAPDISICILALGPSLFAVLANSLRPNSVPIMARYFYPFAPYYFLLLANGMSYLLSSFKPKIAYKTTPSSTEAMAEEADRP